MSRVSYHDLGAAMAYGQACEILETFDSAQHDAFPMQPALLEIWRGIHAAALLEMLDISAERAARTLGDCDDSDVKDSTSEPVGVH